MGRPDHWRHDLPVPPELARSPIGVRELRNNVAAVLRRAAAGERVLVTVDGRPTAQLGPIAPDGAGVTLWDLAAAGLAEPPRRHDRPADPAPVAVPADLSCDRLLDATRGQ
ncbi:MAG: type II toxin-antitoxin system prevent-host-death family antitoxin [Acidimicrobiia bacterium]|nr:type II toxin-antitoxin system prevent-host-death family antitoxin [Acidimicrobiia bacterium]